MAVMSGYCHIDEVANSLRYIPTPQIDFDGYMDEVRIVNVAKRTGGIEILRWYLPVRGIRQIRCL